MIEKRAFLGMNTDHDETVIPHGDYRRAVNFEIGVSNTGSLGIATNTKGNVLIQYKDVNNNSYVLPAGINTTIGSYEDKPNSKIYFFIHNSNKNHLVLLYDIATGATIELIKDSVNNGVLAFDRSFLINHIDFYNGILYWTDGFSEPKKFNVRHFLGQDDTVNKYPSVIREEHITNMTPQPLSEPSSVQIYTDTVYTGNNIYGRTYQFRYSWLYDDESLSGLSPISRLIFAKSKANNTISFNIKTGNVLVKKIFVYGRYGNAGNWFLIEKLDKSVLSLNSNSTHTYYYHNDLLQPFEDVRYTGQNFMRSPIKAFCQSIVEGDRIVYSDYTEDYDNVQVEGHITTQFDAFTYNSGDNEILFSSKYYNKNDKNTNIDQGLKTGFKGQLGWVYFDRFGRHGAVNTSNGFKLNIPQGANNSLTPRLIVRITSQAPSWAVRYAIVRTKNQALEKFIQFIALPPDKSTAPPKTIYYDDDDVSSSYVNATRIKLDFSSISDYFIKNGGIVGYDYTKGDRIRFRRDVKGTIIPTQFDFDILGYENGVVTIDNKIGFDIESTIENIIWELYTPKAITDTPLFYEVYTNDVINAGGGNFYHKGTAQDQTGSQEAIIGLDTFDTYYRLYNIKLADRKIIGFDQTVPNPIPGLGDITIKVPDRTVKGVEIFTILESSYASDYYESFCSDIGRPNRIAKEIKQERRKYNSTYSDRAILETNINGFNAFYDDSFESFTESFGEIQKTFYEHRNLLIFFKRKVGYSPVNTTVIFDNADKGTLATSEKVLNKMIFYEGEFGISDNPESFSAWGEYKYWVDIYRGVVCRLARNGIISISDYSENGGVGQFKMHAFFSQLSIDIFNKSIDYPTRALATRIFGVYNKERDQYIISIINTDDVSDPINQTLAFSEKLNRWTTFYTYLPQHACSYINQYITFNKGLMWLHGTNDARNNFYGKQYSTELDIIFNDGPGQDKDLLALTMNTNKPWHLEVSNSNGQASNIIESDFEKMESEFHSEFRRDINTPYIANPLIDGDTLRGDWARLNMVNNNKDEVTLLNVGVAYVQSNYSFRQ